MTNCFQLILFCLQLYKLHLLNAFVYFWFLNLGLDALGRRNVFAVISFCLFLIVVVNLPMLAIDAHYYGDIIYAPWNIVRYNVVEAKAHLYGLEGWT